LGSCFVEVLIETRRAQRPVKLRMRKILLAALFVVSLFISVKSAHADVAPPPAPQLGGLEPFEYEETNVQMVYERVEMEVQSFLIQGKSLLFPITE